MADLLKSEHEKVESMKKSLISQQEGLKKIDSIIEGMKVMDPNEFLCKTSHVYSIIASNLREIKDEKLSF